MKLSEVKKRVEESSVAYYPISKVATLKMISLLEDAKSMIIAIKHRNFNGNCYPWLKSLGEFEK
jgi:hypothetical protein